MEILNRKARHEYHMLQKFEAGLVLKGTEVKSLRLGQANLSDAYCVFEGSELYIRQLQINEYKFASASQHEAKGSRKLLLNKAELKKIAAARGGKRTYHHSIPHLFFRAGSCQV